MNDEDHLHRAVVQYLMLALPSDAVFFHPPNGEYRSKRTAAKLKAFGVLPGVPDLCFIHEGRFFGVELKAPGRLVGNRMVGRGYCSKSQRSVHAAIKDAGGAVCTAWSLEDVQEALWGWGILERRAA